MKNLLLSVFLVFHILHIGSTEMNDNVVFNKEAEFVIRESDKFHLAFTDLEKLPDGRLLVVYRQGESHVDPSGKIIMHYGSSDGSNWEEARLIHDDPKYDSRDPSLSILSDNSIVLTFFKYHLSPDNQEKTPNIVHTFYSVSKNYGEDFSKPKQIDPGLMEYSSGNTVKSEGKWISDGNLITIKASSSGVIERSNGSWVLPMYCKSPGIFGPITFAESINQTHWSIRDIRPGKIDDLQPNEPSIVCITEDLWLMHIRTQKKGGFTYQSISRDGGKSWGRYRNLEFVGHSPELVRLRSGLLIAAYRVIEDNVKVAFKYSADNGESWSDFIIVEEWDNADCGYPGVVEISDNRIALSYYAVTTEKSIIKVAVYSFK